jgi:hypothetical protein
MSVGKREPVDRNAVRASFWQWDPTHDGDADVEAMDASLSLVRNDGMVLIAVRGKPGRRHEARDSVWLELEDHEVVHLIARLAASLGRQ